MFTDIHSHILPGIDDGARSMDESLAIAQMMVEHGISTVVATPHFLAGVYTPAPDVIRAGVTALQQALDDTGVPLRVLPGAECYLDADLPDRVRRHEVLTLNDTGRYLLLELPMSDYPPYADDVFFELMLAQVTPVLAHPERNAVLAAQPAKAYELVQRGVLLQLNAGSFAGLFGSSARSAAVLFARHGWARFLATDAHRPDARVSALTHAREDIAQDGPVAVPDMVTDYPAAVVQGLALTLPAPLPYEPPRAKSFSLGRLLHRRRS